jgi:hypothetical protein
MLIKIDPIPKVQPTGRLPMTLKELINPRPAQ